MYIKKDFIFPVSISKDAYETKEQITAAIAAGEEGKQLRKDACLAEKVSFRQDSVTPDKLLNYALDGYTFCALFSNFKPNTEKITYLKTDGCFTMSGKADEFFAGSYFVGVDIDKTRYDDAEQLVQRLSYCPTFWYTSLSNQQTDLETGTYKGLRMRLIYVFDTKIEDKYFFRYCSYKVHTQIESDLNEIIKDKCGLKCAQYFNGTTRKLPGIKLRYDVSNIIYSISDFAINNDDYLDFLNNKCYYKHLTLKQRTDIKERICLISSQVNIIGNKKNNTNNIGLGIFETVKITKIRFSDTMLKDNVSMPWEDFYKKYVHQYRYVYRTEKNEWKLFGDDILYQECDLDYLELPWIPKTLTDGHHRRNIIFHRAWLRRVICPSISPDEMLFNLLIDRERFFDNSDKVLSNSLLMKKIRDCFAMPVNDLIEQYSDFFNFVLERSSKKKIILHYSSRGRINANHLRKELRWQILDIMYNTSLTVAENLNVLNDEDLEIGSSTIYRYLTDRGIKKKKESDSKFERFCSLHLDGMSLREERDYLKTYGLVLGVQTISTYRNRLKSGLNTN
jgi:hypothetical protein